MNFKDLGLKDELVNVCHKLQWDNPSHIQRCSIPFALNGRDIIGIAETGGGKTGAFALPIINQWLQTEKPLIYALILTPTRELALQINKQMLLLGENFGLKTCLIIDGDEMSEAIIELRKGESHIVIGTPRRLVALLAKCKTARKMLEVLRHFVIDDADRMLQLEFGPDIKAIANHLPKRNSVTNRIKPKKGSLEFVRQTQLFSATFPKKPPSLQQSLKEVPSNSSNLKYTFQPQWLPGA